MLAIITYKNIFPRDFSDLQLNRGFVYTLFNQKDEICDDERNEIEKNIEEIQKKISSSKNELLTSTHELNLLFAAKYLKNYSWPTYDDNAFTEFLMDNLSENNKNNYLLRTQKLKENLNVDIDYSQGTAPPIA